MSYITLEINNYKLKYTVSKYQITYTRYFTLSLFSASFLRKNKPFLLKNASNLTHEVLDDNFNEKI